MSALDPYTRASPTYQAAIRHRHKSGSAYEGFSRPSKWPARLALLALALFAFTLLTIPA